MSQLVKEVIEKPNDFAYSGDLRLIADPQTGVCKFVPRNLINTEMVKKFALEQQMIPDLNVRVCPMVVLMMINQKPQLRLIQHFVDIKNGDDLVSLDIFAEEWIKGLEFFARFNIHGMSHRIRDFKIFSSEDDITVIFDEP